MRTGSKVHLVNSRTNSVWPGVVTLLFFFIPTVFADPADSDHAAHHPKGSSPTISATHPLAALERAVEKNSPSPFAGNETQNLPATPGMIDQSSTPPASGMGGAGGEMMGKEMMGKEMMEQMGQMMSQMGKPPNAMKSPASSSELPGMPGVSHLYHIGATGFFLDHPDLISFTPEQQAALNRIKEAALLTQATSERKIAQAEQDLWYLTGSDKPNMGKIETKTKDMEALRTEKRLAYIRSVRAATKILTPDQRSTLLRKPSPPAQMAASSPLKSSSATTPPTQPQKDSSGNGGMGDMEKGDM